MANFASSSGIHFMARSPAYVLMSAVARPAALLVSLLWLSTTVAAQYRFDSWTTDNGLPQNSVRSILQTRDGYLWLTTFDGLIRFDGVHFTVFNKSNTKGLSTNRFTALYEGKDGTLWVGTGDGGLTLYRDGVFTSYTIADGMPSGQVLAFAPDLNGELLIGIGNGQFYMRGGKFIPAPAEYQAQDIRHYLAPSGSQWAISANGAKQVRDKRVTQYPMNLSFAEGGWPYEDSHGNLWLGDQSGIYRLRDGQITRYLERDGVPPRTLLRPQCEDDEGGIWFATGLGSVDKSG
jgi:hypothetical protein